MTREEVKELLPVMQAFAEGKMIQDKIEGLTDWVDTDEINLEYEGQAIKHRIKPEPKYRPFKTREECWQEMQKHHLFGWVIGKIYANFHHIDFVYSCNPNNGYGVRLSHNAICPKFEHMFKDYKFADGEPFGIKEE